MPRKGEPLSGEQLAKILATRQRNHGPFLGPEVLSERKRAWDRAYYGKHQDRIKAQTNAYYHANRDTIRETKRDYYKRTMSEARRRWDKWIANPENRAKAQAVSNAYSKAHPELRQKYAANRRARLCGAFVEDVDRRIVLERGNGLCGICGDPVDPARFDVDHIIPLVSGGEHSYANTQPAHPSCNYQKPKHPKERAA